jgi:lactoylglutathione lyase
MPMLQATFDHIQLRSPDPEATARWFEQMLGAEIVRTPGRVDIRFGSVNVFIAPVRHGDHIGPPPVTPHQGLDHFGLTVDDIVAAAAELKAQHVVFTQDVTVIRPGVRACFIRGPQGISIELLQRDRP